MIREILISVLILAMFYSLYKMGYLASEIKFINMVKRMISKIDFGTPMAEYNLEFIEMLQKEFDMERGE